MTTSPHDRPNTPTLGPGGWLSWLLLTAGGLTFAVMLLFVGVACFGRLLTDARFRHLAALSEGPPIILQYEYPRQSTFSLDGQELTFPQDEQIVLRASALSFPPSKPRADFAADVYSVATRSTDRSSGPSDAWFFVRGVDRRGYGYLEGRRVDGRRLGYVGRGGFRDTRPPAEDQFACRAEVPVQGRNHASEGEVTYSYAGFSTDFYLLTDEGLVRVDTVARTVSTPSWRNGVVAISPLADRGEDGGTTVSLAALTAESVRLLDEEGRHVVTEWTLPEELRGKSILTLRLGDDLWVYRSGTTPDFRMTRLWRIPAGGEAVSQGTVDLGYYYSPAQPSLSWVGSPLVGAAFALAEAWPSGVRPVTWVGLLLSVAAAAACVWRLRRDRARRGIPRSTAWAMAVALAGPAGLLAYHALNVWPEPVPTVAPRTGSELIAA